MAGLTATYVDATTFTISQEKDDDGNLLTDIFVSGRRVKADCGADGVKYSEAVSSSYDGTSDETTVNIDDSVLTANLSKVWFGVSSSGTEGDLPTHDHSLDKQGGTVVHGDLTGVSSGDHHTKYTDSEAETAINNDADHGSTASHDYFSGDHGDLSSVTSAQHHTKYALTDDLATGEITQVQNINSVSISNSQWGYLGGMGAQPVEPSITSGSFAEYFSADPDGDSLHFELIVSENRDMSSPVIDKFSSNDQTNWYYDDGSGFVSIPSGGVPGGSQPCTVEYNWTSSEISRDTTYYIRWRSHDGTSYSDPFFDVVTF